MNIKKDKIPESNISDGTFEKEHIFADEIELYRYLLDGGVISNKRCDMLYKIVNNVLLFKQSSVEWQMSSKKLSELNDASDWETHIEPKWYDNIPTCGIFCWTTSADYKASIDIELVIEYDPSTGFLQYQVGLQGLQQSLRHKMSYYNGVIMFEPLSTLPDIPGEYNVIIDGIMSCAAIYYEFDGEKWIIPDEWKDRNTHWWRE